MSDITAGNLPLLGVRISGIKDTYTRYWLERLSVMDCNSCAGSSLRARSASHSASARDIALSKQYN